MVSQKAWILFASFCFGLSRMSLLIRDTGPVSFNSYQELSLGVAKFYKLCCTMLATGGTDYLFAGAARSRRSRAWTYSLPCIEGVCCSATLRRLQRARPEKTRQSQRNPRPEIPAACTNEQPFGLQGRLLGRMPARQHTMGLQFEEGGQHIETCSCRSTGSYETVRRPVEKGPIRQIQMAFAETRQLQILLAERRGRAVVPSLQSAHSICNIRTLPDSNPRRYICNL